MYGATPAPRISHRSDDPSQYEPCHNAMATALGWAYGKPTACAHVPTGACTKPTFGEGHVQANSVFGPEPGTGQQQHPHFPTQILHHSPMAQPYPARHQPSGKEQGQPGTSSDVRHPGTRTTSLHETIEPSDAFGVEFSWSAQVQPFGDGRGHTDPTPGPGQSNKPCLKNWTTQESHGQILHQERAAANLAEGCGRLAEFFAQFPWEEKIIGLGFAQLNVE